MVRKEEQYIHRSLRKIFQQLRKLKHPEEIIVLVLVVEEDRVKANDSLTSLSKTFGKEIASGGLVFLQPNQDYFQLFKESFSKLNKDNQTQYLRFVLRMTNCSCHRVKVI